MMQIPLPLPSTTTCSSLDITQLDGRGLIHYSPSAHSKSDEISAVSRRLEIFTRLSTVANSLENHEDDIMCCFIL
jgi:hypothetical protein